MMGSFIVISIVVICYVIGEIYKSLVKFNESKYKYIPVIVMVCGGVIGLLCYLVDRDIIFNANNILEAVLIGIASGSVSVSSHQVIKQLIKYKESE